MRTGLAKGVGLWTLMVMFVAACGGNSSQSKAEPEGNSGRGGAGSPSPLERCPSCGDGEACCFLTGKCYSPEVAPEECEPPAAAPSGSGGAAPVADPATRRCSSNAHCEETEFCRPDDDASACLGPGYCVARSCELQCTGGAMCETPVCGCDGVTYETEDGACRAGVRVATTAPCGEPVSMDGPVVIGCGSDVACPNGYACCEISGRCYDVSCPGCCQVSPPGTSGACERDEHCAVNQYCAGSGCDGPGGCVWPRSSDDCGGEIAEVCGCDGRTYTNDCWAGAAGVRVARAGRCG